MNPRDDIYAALSGDPNDWTTRSILADLFEEAGEQDRADCMRWTIAQRKRPSRSTDGQFHWFNQKTVNVKMDPESDIPDAIYTRMKAKEGLKLIFRDYKTLADADEDFFTGWLAARDEGLLGNE